MRSFVLLALLPCVTALTECQKCCAPGGDCSKASHGNPGVCCGQVEGNSYCCPAVSAKCWACASSYRCYQDTRPASNICAHEGGGTGGQFRSGSLDATSGVLLFSLMLLVCAAVVYSRQRSRSVPLATQQGIAMAPVGHPVGLPMAKPATLAAGTSTLPVAQAVPAQAMPAMGGRPMYVGGPSGYGGYGGGSVAMGAGMGFLGGMMVGDMMADAGGHYGGGYGGDYGGGGDFGGGDGGFAADM